MGRGIADAGLLTAMVPHHPAKMPTASRPEISKKRRIVCLHIYNTWVNGVFGQVAWPGKGPGSDWARAGLRQFIV
jgi:hypothetical protein